MSLPEIDVSDKRFQTVNLIDAVADAFGESKSQARRLLKDGAVKIDGVKVHDHTCARMDIEGKVLQAGKRKFVKIVLTDEG